MLKSSKHSFIAFEMVKMEENVEKNLGVVFDFITRRAARRKIMAKNVHACVSYNSFSSSQSLI
jgi:hypothetical protein